MNPHPNGRGEKSHYRVIPYDNNLIINVFKMPSLIQHVTLYQYNCKMCILSVGTPTC